MIDNPYDKQKTEYYRSVLACGYCGGEVLPTIARDARCPHCRRDGYFYPMPGRTRPPEVKP